MHINLRICVSACTLSLALCACAERDDGAPSPSPGGGGKADDPTCTATCPIACSDGECAVATQLSTGGWHTCARLDDGSVWCWGSDWTGQLGLGLSGYPQYSCANGTTSTPCRRRPHRVHGLPPVSQVVAGEDHTCAIVEDRTVRCWGSNYAWVLGIGNQTVGQCNVAGVQVDCLKTPDGDPGLNDVVAIAPAEHHTCALTAVGEVWCWGTNGSGQLGSQRSASRVPVLVPSLSGVKAIASGKQHTCAVMSDDKVMCWGQNDYGQVGDGTSSFWHWTPTEVVGLSDVAQLALGERFSCARLLNGDVRCWGSNTFGELGTGSFTSSLVPVAVSGLANVTDIAAGSLRACARSQTGVHCWGIGGQGLGFVPTTSCPANPSYKCAAEPGLVSGLSDATQLGVSAVHSCSLGADGQVSCWGDNLAGALGDGMLADRESPQPVDW